MRQVVDEEAQLAAESGRQASVLDGATPVMAQFLEIKAANEEVRSASGIDLSSSHPEAARMGRATIEIFGDSLDSCDGSLGK